MSKPLLTGAALASAKNSMIKTLIQSGVFDYCGFSGDFTAPVSGGGTNHIVTLGEISCVATNLLSQSYNVVEKAK